MTVAVMFCLHIKSDRLELQNYSVLSPGMVARPIMSPDVTFPQLWCSVLSAPCKVSWGCLLAFCLLCHRKPGFPASLVAFGAPQPDQKQVGQHTSRNSKTRSQESLLNLQEPLQIEGDRPVLWHRYFGARSSLVPSLGRCSYHCRISVHVRLIRRHAHYNAPFTEELDPDFSTGIFLLHRDSSAMISS